MILASCWDNTRLWQILDYFSSEPRRNSAPPPELRFQHHLGEVGISGWPVMPVAIATNLSGMKKLLTTYRTYRRPYPISADVNVIGKYCDRGKNTIAIVGVILNVLRTWLTYLSHRVAHQFEYTWNPKWCSRSYHYSDLNDCQIENLQCVILKVLSVPFIPDFLKTQAHIINKSVSKLQII